MKADFVHFYHELQNIPGGGKSSFFKWADAIFVIIYQTITMQSLLCTLNLITSLLLNFRK